MQKKRDERRKEQEKGKHVEMGRRYKVINEVTKGKTEMKNREKLGRKIRDMAALHRQKEADLFVIPAGE